MKRMILYKCRMLTLLCCGLLASGSAFPDKPSWNGGDHGDNQGNDRGKSKSGKNKSRDNYRGKDERRRGNEINNNRDRNNRGHDGNDQRADRDHHYRDKMYSSRYFDSHRRNSIHEYYSQRGRSGRCPPGLAKRDNGCVSPGHKKRWAVGQSLPRDVIFYNVEPQVLSYLGPPPPRHRFVRVASDILLIAVGTGMVLDAIDDLDRY